MSAVHILSEEHSPKEPNMNRIYRLLTGFTLVATLSIAVFPGRPALADPESYVATLIPMLPGDNIGVGTALSQTGVVVGVSATDSEAHDTPLIWVPSEPNLAVGNEMTLPTGGLVGYLPLCINHHGVIGGNDQATNRAMLILPDGSTKFFDPPNSKGVLSAVNDSDVALVTVKSHALAYSIVKKTFTPLRLPAGYKFDLADQINDSGAVIGYAYNDSSGTDVVAVYWPTIHSAPQVIAQSESFGIGINSFGHAILENNDSNTGSYGTFTYWSKATGIISPEISAPEGLHINDEDDVVGMNYADITNITPFLWNPDSGYVDLTDSLPVSVGDITGFDDAGQLIVETFQYPNYVSYLLTPNVIVSDVSLPDGNSVTGPATIQIVVSLAHPVLAKTAVRLESDSPAVVVPEMTTILSGKPTHAFTAQVLSVEKPTVVQITATANGPYGPTTGSVPITVQP